MSWSESIKHYGSKTKTQIKDEFSSIIKLDNSEGTKYCEKCHIEQDIENKRCEYCGGILVLLGE